MVQLGTGKKLFIGMAAVDFLNNGGISCLQSCGRIARHQGRDGGTPATATENAHLKFGVIAHLSTVLFNMGNE